jgi:RND family efflux transporter MFP subunit
VSAPPLAGADLDRLRIDRGTPGARRRRRRSGPWIVLAILLVVAGAGVYAAMGKELLAPKVTTARVQRVAPTDGLVRTTASGYVVARRRASISSRLSGRLEKLNVDVGDDVKAGQVLGQLGCADLDAAVLEAKATVVLRRAEVENAKRDAASAAAAADVARTRVAEPESMLPEMESRLDDAEKTLAREQALKPGVSTSQEALDHATMERDVARRKIDQVKAQIATMRSLAAQADVQAAAMSARVPAAEAAVAAAEAAVKQAEATRADADIVAPFSGRVLRKEAEIGEMVAPVNSAGSTTRGAIVTLADFTTLEMEVDVIERDIGLIEPGAPCRIVLDSRVRDDHPYAGVVRQIEPTADRTKSTVQVKISFKDLDGAVSPEMSGRVEFLKKGSEGVVLGKDRVFVPKAALVEYQGKRGAFEVDDGKAAFREVALPSAPAERDGLVEIASGFTGGEDVVLSPPPSLAPGDLVRAAGPAK